MKNRFIVLFSVASAWSILYSGIAKAQLTYETTYSGSAVNQNHRGFIASCRLNESSTKYLTAEYDVTGEGMYNLVYRLYNLDHSLYRTLEMITDTMVGGYPFPISIQENLFNLDATIEVAYRRYRGPVLSSFKIVDENGNLIFERDSLSSRNPTFIGTEVGTKMVLEIGEANSSYISNRKEVYALGGVRLNIPKPDDGTGVEMMVLSPNPSTEFARLTYSLPAGVAQAEVVLYNNQGWEVKRFVVDGTFSDLLVSNAELRAGTYHYCMMVNGNVVGSKSAIVIR
jgi:hypothetical protein